MCVERGMGNLQPLPLRWKGTGIPCSKTWRRYLSQTQGLKEHKPHVNVNLMHSSSGKQDATQSE